MIHRPVDASGDILPVLSSADLLRGSRAAAQLVRDRLTLFTGDWWENPAWGNEILEMLEESRLTDADGQVLASYLTAFIRETPGAGEVREANVVIAERSFQYSCWVDTENESIQISYNI